MMEQPKASLASGPLVKSSCALPNFVQADASLADVPSAAKSTTPPLIAWANSVFAGAENATSEDVSLLLQEAADASRSEFDQVSAITWADGYEFPSQFIESDSACLRAHQLDFVSMVRRRFDDTIS
jgi:hypothetical protein